MEKPPTRRTFFGLAGAAALAPACGGPPRATSFDRAIDKPYVPGAERFATYEERFINTSCAQCPAGCGIRVRVVEGRAVRIEGNEHNPLNRGGIGPRGLAGLQALYDPDRLTGPMQRIGGQLVATTWDAAIAKVADRLTALRNTGTANRVLVVSGRERGMMHELWARFCRAYGTPNFIEGGHGAVLSQAMQAAVGTYTIPAYDWGGARFVLSLEGGLLEDSCQSVYFTRVAAELRRGRGGGRARIVHAGPVFDLSAYNADEWVQIAPGTSGALALGLAHVLVRDDKFDRDFVQDRSHDFGAFAAALQEYTPERASTITGAPVRTIERLAAEMHESTRAFAIADDRTLAFTNGLATAHATLGLNALLGALGREDGGVIVEPAPPYAPWPDPDVDATVATTLATPRLDRAGTSEFPFARGVFENLPEVLAGPNAPEVVLLYHANPAWARAQPARWRAALAKVPLVVSFSPYRDETVDELAHVVLPDHTYLERWEDAGAAPGVGKPVVGIRRPVVEPLHDTRATGDVVLDLAKRIGGSVATSLPWPTFASAMEVRLAGLFGALRGKVRGTRELLDQLYEDGFWADLDAQPAELRFGFQAGWSLPEWAGDATAFPLALIAYRPLGYAEGSGANQPWLRHLRTRPGQRPFETFATVHPDDVPGIADREHVEITSPFGTIRLPVMLDRRMWRGAIAVPLGGGHTAFGRWAKGVGANPAHLLASGPARGSGANAMCTTRVRIERSHGKGGA